MQNKGSGDTRQAEKINKQRYRKKNLYQGMQWDKRVMQNVHKRMENDDKESDKYTDLQIRVSDGEVNNAGEFG